MLPPESCGSPAECVDTLVPPGDGEDDVEEIPVSEGSWLLTSAKPGNGVEQLLESNIDTYWQSDGPQPHRITVTFFRKMKLSDIWILFNH